MEQRRLPARKRGNRLGFWFFKRALHFFGARGAYGLLYPVCLYYLLFDRAAVRGALAYIVRRFPEAGMLRRIALVYRLFISQGMQLIDRYAALSGALSFTFDLRGADLMREALARSHAGLILLTAHMGNWQLALSTLEHMGKQVHLVMRPEDNQAVQRALRLGKHEKHIRVISAASRLDTALEITRALRNGDIVSFMGDRPFDFEAEQVRFLGDTAHFPRGPFQIAAAIGCPIQILFCARLSHRRYLVDFSNLLLTGAEGKRARCGRIPALMQEYAGLLDAFAAKYPFQCFLFTDIWSPRPNVATRPPTREKSVAE